MHGDATTMTAALVGALTLACSSDGGSAASSGADLEESSESSAGPSVGDDDVVEVEVPADLPVQRWDSSCHPTDGVAHASAGPDGALWIADGVGRWRVVDPLGGESTTRFELAADDLRGWTRDRAFVRTGGQLFDVRGAWPLPIEWPTDAPAIESSCGDPSTDANGFVAALGLHQRDGGHWWSWTAPGGLAFPDIAWFAAQAGSCIDLDGATWLGTADGRSWRLHADRLDRLPSIDDASAAAFVDGLGVAAIVDDAVVVGSPESGWIRHRFAAGTPTRVSASAGVLWVLAGGEAHRFADGEWSRLGSRTALQELVADGGGAWTLIDGWACHVHEAAPLVVAGAHHLQRVADEVLAVELAGQPEAGPVAWLDAVEVAVEPGARAGEWRASVPLPERGWHELKLVWSAGGELRERALAIERRDFAGLAWEQDIEPIFAAHCGGTMCHGPDPDAATRPDLSTEAAWLEHGDAILARVSIAGDMPPPASRSDTWNHDVALMIFEWLEARDGG